MLHHRLPMMAVIGMIAAVFTATMSPAHDGAMIAVSDDSNSTYYGKAVRPTDILLKKSVMNPASAELRSAITALTSKN